MTKSPIDVACAAGAATVVSVALGSFLLSDRTAAFVHSPLLPQGVMPAPKTSNLRPTQRNGGSSGDTGSGASPWRPVQHHYRDRGVNTVGMGDHGDRGDAGGDNDGAPPVLCHGEILFDCIANPDAAGWDLTRVVENDAWTAYPGGAPANVACALSKLGIPASFVGAVGADDCGDELMHVIESSGVGTELTTTCDEYPTRTVMVTRDMAGDRTFSGFGAGKPCDCFADCYHRLSGMKDMAMHLLQPGAWVVQGTLGLAYPASQESHFCLAEWAREVGAVRFVDINWRPVFWELAADGAGGDVDSLARERISAFSLSADVVKLTDEEAEWLCGVSPQEALQDPSCLSEFFPAAKAILVTAGAKGAAYNIGGHTGFVPCFGNVKIVETTGAGDAFSAGFIAGAIRFMSRNKNYASESDENISDGTRSGLGLLEGVSKEEAKEMVRFASAVGALTCTGDGAIKPQPRESDVLQLLKEEGAALPSE